MWKQYLKAARLARKAHGSQKRAQGTPYYKHPMAVARLVWQRGYTGAVIQAAYLHDVLEDCEMGMREFTSMFGHEVARLVYAVTKQLGETSEAYYLRVKAAGEEAMVLKRTDREHNNSELRYAPKCTCLHSKAAEKTAMMNKVFNQ